ncbi:MAG: hypothetical protein ACXAC8_07080 [Candidatus Hodarchaeales archaeon]
MRKNRLFLLSSLLVLLFTITILSSSPTLGMGSESFRIGQDTEAPSVMVIQPANFSDVSRTFLLSVNASDDIGIDKVVYREIASQVSYSEMVKNSTTPNQYYAWVDSMEFSNGVVFIEIVANDTSGKVTSIVLFLGIFNLKADIIVYNAVGLAGECPCMYDENSSAFWGRVPGHPIEEFGPNGYAKFSHNFTHLFGLFVFDASYQWVSLEFDNDGNNKCMETGEDVWEFHENKPLADYTSVGTSKPIADDIEDITFEYGVLPDGNSNLRFVELIRAFVTDEPGDVVFQFGSQVNILFASDAVHYGGAGDLRTNFTLALETQAVGSESTSTSSPPNNNTTPMGINMMTDLIVYGGIGLVINSSLIVGLVVYNRKR